MLAAAVRLREPGGRPRRLGAAADDVDVLRLVDRLRVVVAFLVDDAAVLRRVLEGADPAALARRAVVLRRRVVARLVTGTGAVLLSAASGCSDIISCRSSNWGLFFSSIVIRAAICLGMPAQCVRDVSLRSRDHRLSGQ